MKQTVRHTSKASRDHEELFVDENQLGATPASCGGSIVTYTLQR